jgi:hypothetical protein
MILIVIIIVIFVVADKASRKNSSCRRRLHPVTKLRLQWCAALRVTINITSYHAGTLRKTISQHNSRHASKVIQHTTLLLRSYSPQATDAMALLKVTHDFRLLSTSQNVTLFIPGETACNETKAQPHYDAFVLACR